MANEVGEWIGFYSLRAHQLDQWGVVHEAQVYPHAKLLIVDDVSQCCYLWLGVERDEHTTLVRDATVLQRESQDASDSADLTTSAGNARMS